LENYENNDVYVCKVAEGDDTFWYSALED